MSTSFMMRNVEPAKPISFDKDKCIGCNKCMNVCPIDIFLPAEKKGDHPVVAFPDECWYCGCCVMECPHDAIMLKHPLMNQPRWVEKSSLLKESEKKL